MKFLVLLAGCGLGDGSCIEEAVLTYTALDKYGCDYTPAAADMPVPSMDHITEQPGEKRSVLTESARMGRGRIRNLRDVSPDDYDALLIPGGIGLVVNYRGSALVADWVNRFVRQKKPIGTMCAGIDFLRGILGAGLLQEESKALNAVSFCRDSSGAIFYTPAFRKTGSCHDVMLGVDAMVHAILEYPGH